MTKKKSRKSQGRTMNVTDGVAKDIVIPVMGPTGAGKSTFINTLLGEERMLVGHELTSCTIQPQAITINPIPRHSRLKGYRLVLVDTPGFDDTYMGDAEILGRIAKWLETSYREEKALGGVVYLHDISHDRFSGTARRNLDMFRYLCGEDALNNVVLGTTKWGRITADDGDRRERELEDIHWKPLIDKGSMVRRSKGDLESAWDVIDVLLFKAIESMDTALEIQQELVDHQKIIPETRAGRELRYTLQQVLEMQKQVAGFEAALAAGGDPEAQEKLKETQERLHKMMKQVRALKIPLPRRFRAFFGI
jgi:GTP-binding protein EngB required for normal cell division